MRATARPRPTVQLAQSYVYDEWDHTLADYRSRHCHVHELPLDSDAGAFFEQTLRDNRELLAQVRRQFEHMRPERYRTLRGLEDGEDFDLNALTAARVESRAGRTPSTRIYTARTRQVRDVATLFLLDMSASTEQPYERADDAAPRRIIDTLKEALVVMCTALDTLGDEYAIYGFSSQGRKRVEVYEVKAFNQPLGAAAKSRLGSIGPRHGTRMGAALRHALSKFASVQAHARHLILLSDGFPQDQEYGEDRRTHTYGMKDTAVALRELTRAGTLPFCITIDRAGHDYLRLMCDPEQYMVIDHIDQLPRELPKIYRRIVR
jgi:nitric oxide reductase activation protein